MHGQTLYFRRYPTRGLAAHLVGYSTHAVARRARAVDERLPHGLEREPRARRRPRARQAARPARGGNDSGPHAGPARSASRCSGSGASAASVVALEPSTGSVLVMASSPTYDPNLIEKDYRSILRDAADCQQAAPLLNRATQGPRAGLDVQDRHRRGGAGHRALHAGDRVRRSGLLQEYGNKVSTTPTRPARGVRLGDARRGARSTRSTRCSATSARSSARADRAGLWKASASTRFRRSRRPSDERRASGLYKNGKPSSRRTTRARSTPVALAFGQAGCW